MIRIKWYQANLVSHAGKHWRRCWTIAKKICAHWIRKSIFCVRLAVVSGEIINLDILSSNSQFCWFAFVITANSSPKISAASRLAKKRIECMSQREQDELKEFAWFQAGIPREISLEVLLRKNPGEFLVRDSATKPGCFALSLRVPPPGPKVAHYLIVKTSRGYKIKVSIEWDWERKTHKSFPISIHNRDNILQLSGFQ